MNARLMFVHVLSPLHAGSGQGVGTIDLPISRERATEIPYLPGSSLKGVLRDTCKDDTWRKAIFGPETKDAADHAGSVQFSDQRLLLLPVRSYAGTFAWVTSPYILNRLVRDWRAVGGDNSISPIPYLAESECMIPEKSFLISSKGDIVLDEFKLATKNSKKERAGEWARWLGERLFPADKIWQNLLASHLAIVNDYMMKYFMVNGTEIVTRIRLKKDSKTAADKGLWYEEYLPCETILVGLVVVTPVRKVKKSAEEMLETISDLVKKPVQLGGKTTVGKGLCRLQMLSRKGAE